MVKRKDNKKVIEMSAAKEVNLIASDSLTKEEIEKQMKKDEREIERRLKKYAAINPMSESSGVEEQEDEEEETITLEFTEDGATAYQKIDEGLAVYESKGDVAFISEEQVLEKVKETVLEMTEPLKPTMQQRYENMITDRLVSKAVGSLLERLNAVQKKAEGICHENGLGFLSERTAMGVYEVIEKQKVELRKSWSGGVLKYESIPAWARPWIDDYITNGLNSLMDFVERD